MIEMMAAKASWAVPIILGIVLGMARAYRRQGKPLDYAHSSAIYVVVFILIFAFIKVFALRMLA